MASSIQSNRVLIKSTQYAKAGKSLFLNEKYADVHFTFNCHDQCETIPAHKNILASSCSAFETMLDGRWKETDEVEIEDASAEGFKEFLQFFYLDEVEITIENISEVMYLAKKYLLDKCLDMCQQTLMQQKTMDYVCIGLEIALSFDLFELKKYCLKIIEGNTSAVFAEDAFCRCSKDVLKCMLVNAMNCDEKVVFDACMNWAKHASQKNETDASVMENLKHELGDCLYLIQFGSMNPQQISECVLSYKGLFNQDELEDLWSLQSSNQSPKIFKKVERIEERIHKWTDISILECWLVADRDRRFSFASIERVATIKVNKAMLFGAISTALLYKLDAYDQNTASGEASGDISISEIGFGVRQGERRTLLRQRVHFNIEEDGATFHYSKINYTEFNKVILVKPNYEYEIRIEFNESVKSSVLYSTKDLQSEIRFGKDNDYKVTVNVIKSHNFLACLYFNER